MSFFYCLFRYIVLISALFLTLLGIGVFGYGCYILSLIIFQNYQGINYTHEGFFILDDDFIMFTQNYGALIIGSLLLLFGIIGFLGSTTNRVKCKRAFLLIFQISLISFSIIFIALSIIMLIEAKKYFSQECESTEQFKELSDGVKKSDQLFCSIGCPCNLDARKFVDKSALIGKIGFQNANLPKQVQKCTLFDSQEYTMFSQFMKILEEDYECSGWCQKTQVYVFSDVNRGNTNGFSCFVKFQIYYEKYITVVGYFSLSLGILFAISSFLIFWLYCYFGNEERLKKFKKQQEMLLRQ